MKYFIPFSLLPVEQKEINALEDIMSGYVLTSRYENQISVVFHIEADKPFAIGEKMNELNEEAYMNGYNWEAFFDYYLRKHAPDVLENMNPDPEAGMYAAYYDPSPENLARAKKFVDIIINLIENEEELYHIVREEGDKIEFD